MSTRHARTANAWLPPRLQVRAGVPHHTGRLPAQCADTAVPVMVSAGAFWRDAKKSFVTPSRWGWSVEACDVALDSAGFVAMTHWAAKGPQAGMMGCFPWTLEQYFQLVCDVWPNWYSAPDACVEPEIAPDDDAVRSRMWMTTQLLRECLLHGQWLSQQTQGRLKPCVPVVQGWRAEQYRESLLRVLDVWDDITSSADVFERQPTLIGVGSVCRRNLQHPKHGLWRVLDAIAGEIPSGTRLHLFGVKSGALPRLSDYPCVASVDSMAWDFRARKVAREEGISNTLEHRAAHLQRWHDRQLGRIEIEQTAELPQMPLFEGTDAHATPPDGRAHERIHGPSAALADEDNENRPRFA